MLTCQVRPLLLELRLTLRPQLLLSLLKCTVLLTSTERDPYVQEAAVLFRVYKRRWRVVATLRDSPPPHATNDRRLSHRVHDAYTRGLAKIHLCAGPFRTLQLCSQVCCRLFFHPAAFLLHNTNIISDAWSSCNTILREGGGGPATLWYLASHQTEIRQPTLSRPCL